MIEDRDLRVGEGPEVVGEAIELGQVERPACHAGDVAAGDDDRHGDGDDRDVREPPEDHFRTPRRGGSARRR